MDLVGIEPTTSSMPCPSAEALKQRARTNDTGSQSTRNHDTDPIAPILIVLSTWLVIIRVRGRQRRIHKMHSTERRRDLDNGVGLWLKLKQSERSSARASAYPSEGRL